MPEAVEFVEMGTIYRVALGDPPGGPARGESLQEEAIALLREAVDACGGDAFKRTDDGLMAAFTSPSAAVECAVLTQQLFEHRYRDSASRPWIRIGLGTGESTRKDGDYFGMPAIVASRLCPKAPEGGILVAEITKDLAARVDDGRFQEHGAMDLKGIPEPIAAHLVRWDPLDPEQARTATGPWPLPSAMRAAPTVTYIGRRDERARLERSRRAAQAGAPQTLLISGEPGIGKTRLASYGAFAASLDGFAICWGACSEDVAAPYEPWIAVCSQIVEHLPHDELAAYVEQSGGDVGRVAHDLHRRVPGAPPPRASDPETERLLLFNAVAALLRAAAGSSPLCVVLDDFHWADRQSMILLKHVAASVERGALQILVTFRDSDLDRDHPFIPILADLRRIEGVRRVALSGLAAEEVALLLRDIAGHELDAAGTAFASDLAGDTGGNPFFVGEMLRNLAEAGALVPDPSTGRWRASRAMTQAVPESVREVIARRVGRLGGEAPEVLAIAAAIGRSFDVALLADVAEVEQARLLALLEEGVGAALVHESADRVGRFTFEHALINHTLYEGLGATRRARLHQRIAEALEAQLGDRPGARIGELAGHWDRAAGLNAGKAIAYAQLAGDHALRELAPDEALRWFRRALELFAGRDDSALECDLLIGLGEAQRRTGDPAYRQTLLDASRIASALEDGARAARAALTNYRGQTSAFGHVDAERLAALDRALELDDDVHRRAHLLAVKTSELLYESDSARCLRAAQDALAIAREVGRPATTVAALSAWFRARQNPDGLEDRVAHVDELLAASALLGDSPAAFFATTLSRNALMESGRIDRACELGEQMDGIVGRLGDPRLQWIREYYSGCWALLRGDVDQAERHAQQALERGSALNEPDALMIYGAQIVPIRIVQGRSGEILELLDQAIRNTPRIVGFSAAKAQILALAGRIDDARVLLADAVQRRFEHVGNDQTRSLTLAMYAEAAVDAAASDAAVLLYENMERTPDQMVWNGVNTYGHQRVYLGLLAASLGHDERADEHFSRAIELQERHGLRAWVARAHLGWAEALAARGEQARARQHAGLALAAAERHGYGMIEPRAAAIAAS